MKAKMMLAVVMTLCLSVGAFAQNHTQVYKVKPKLTPEQREARRAEMKAKLAQMTPEERKAFRKAHHEQLQARLNNMSPEQREKFMERRRQHKAMKLQEGK